MRRIAQCMILCLVLLAPVTASKAEVSEESRKAIKRCVSCHTFTGEQGRKPGPDLKGVYMRKIGALGSYKYSRAMAEKGAEGAEWDEPNLDAYIENPVKFIRRGLKSLPGIRDEATRRAIIDFLKADASP